MHTCIDCTVIGHQQMIHKNLTCSVLLQCGIFSLFSKQNCNREESVKQVAVMVRRPIAITSNQRHNLGCYFSQCCFVCVYVIVCCFAVYGELGASQLDVA